MPEIPAEMPATSEALSAKAKQALQFRDWVTQSWEDPDCVRSSLVGWSWWGPLELPLPRTAIENLSVLKIGADPKSFFAAFVCVV